MPIHKPICPYCDQPSIRRLRHVQFPHLPKLKNKVFFVCDNCNARVGTHPGTSIPLGDLAGPELRRARSEAHTYFDALWQKEVFVSRSAAYAWLAKELGISGSECHIGMFDLDTCKKVTKLAIEKGAGTTYPSLFK